MATKAPEGWKVSGVVDCSTKVDASGLNGKTAVVTGGSSGLGLAYVKAFAKAGTHVVIADIAPPADTSQEPNVHYVKCDVRSWQEQVAVFRKALEISPAGRIDIVVANAGISGADGLLEDIDADEPIEPDLRVTQINLIGAMFTVRLALHFFGKQKDQTPWEKCLMLQSSIMGYLDSRPVYGSAKFGVRALMRGLRWDGRCRINVSAPWFIRTPLMTETVAEVLKGQLHAQGTDFALPEDAVQCALRIAADQSINGRAFAILPRNFASDGYIDLNLDHWEEGTLYYELQRITGTLSHRKLPKSQQLTEAHKV